MYLQQWHGWCHMKLLPSQHVLCTPYNHAPCHFMQSHVHKVYVCLAVTCRLRFCQNDRNLLHATALTQGWNRYQNKCQHRKLTLEKRIFPPLQQGFKPATFWSHVWRSNHWAIPTPQQLSTQTCLFLFHLPFLPSWVCPVSCLRPIQILSVLCVWPFPENSS